LWQAVQFSRDLTVQRARQLFYASILYLPLLLGLMVWDKIK
jgi:heme O synthase-like polyprenyltransferase